MIPTELLRSTDWIDVPLNVGVPIAEPRKPETCIESLGRIRQSDYTGRFMLTYPAVSFHAIPGWLSCVDVEDRVVQQTLVTL